MLSFSLPERKGRKEAGKRVPLDRSRTVAVSYRLSPADITARWQRLYGKQTHARIVGKAKAFQKNTRPGQKVLRLSAFSGVQYAARLSAQIATYRRGSAPYPWWRNKKVHELARVKAEGEPKGWVSYRIKSHRTASSRFFWYFSVRTEKYIVPIFGDKNIKKKERNPMYTLLKQEGRARRGQFETVHGTIQTPVFMNVGTSAAIKGGISTQDLYDVKCQVELSNTYHLHVRPGDDVIFDMGGIHKFFNWDRPVLTDSGGFQVFSLSQLRKITEEGVKFASHVDGKRIFMGPEESMQIQSHIASTIAMAFDECIENPAPRDYVRKSIDRTTRWLERCKNEMARLNSLPETINKNQLLFGINQGGTYDDLRIEHMQRISEFDLPGYAIGGLAVGEEAEVMYHIIEQVEPFMPKEKPRYLMGVGTPWNILEAVYRGIDFFDCVMPSRNARHGYIFTWNGTMNINNQKYQRDPLPIDPNCGCPACKFYSRSYIRHLLKADEMLGMRLAVLHNLYFYNDLMEKIREALDEGRYEEFYRHYREILPQRI